VTEGRSLDAHELLQLLAEQQTCLGQQLATLGQLQQLVLQHITGDRRQGATPVVSAAAAQAQMPEAASAETHSAFMATHSGSAPQAATGQIADESVADTTHAEVPPTTAETILFPKPAPSEAPNPISAASTADSPIGEAPALHQVGVVRAPVGSAPSAFNSRSARYLQPNAPAPARRVTSQDVNRVARLYEVGDAAHLVLQFGEYRGASLIQVAHVDPDYIRSLALTAQRPQVRAAASAMVRALEASERTAMCRRPGSSHSSRTRP
jgi:hypothetical protein